MATTSSRKNTKTKSGGSTRSSASKAKSSSRYKKSSGAYARTNAPKRPAKVKSELDLARDKEIVGIVLITIAVLLLVSFALVPQEGAVDVSAMGVLCGALVRALRFLAGKAAIILPLCLLIFGICVCMDRNNPQNGRLLGEFLIVLSVMGFCHLPAEMLPFREYMAVAAQGEDYGGVIGGILVFGLRTAMGGVGAAIVLVAVMIIGLLLTFQTSLAEIAALLSLLCSNIANLFRSHREQRPTTSSEKRLSARESRLTETEHSAGALERNIPIYNHDDPAPVITTVEEIPTAAPPKKTRFAKNFLPDISEPEGMREATVVPPPAAEEPALKDGPAFIGFDMGDAAEAPLSGTDIHAEADKCDTDWSDVLDAMEQPKTPLAPASTPGLETASTQPDGETAAAGVVAAEPVKKPYVLPPVDLISPGRNVRNPRMNRAITENIGVLESTLESFGVRATVTQVVAGPAVTRYELQPAPGVKVSRITSLTDDIALALAAQGVRIEAPIPGKNAIGIEVARSEIDTVFFREMIESEEFQKSDAKLSFALGKNIGGEAIIGNLGKMPHLLIAGTTGSGKSVCENIIICSILYKATPDEVKLLLIDPKKVEMTQYATLPHLIAPVVTDSKKAANALKWVVNEMETRYSLFAGAGVKKFEDYNAQHPDEKLPHIVVVIDELADLMMVARHDVEDSICRLAQLARAAGIHMVVATQRPSVDVITGLIKANIPSRIAFSVSSATDSRTMIDTGGAEKLLGNGDMLYSPIGVNKPIRVQGTFISEKDVERLVAYCAEQASPHFSETAVQAAVHGEPIGDSSGGNGGGNDGDELLYDAAMLIVSTGQASTSFLQRKLAIGNPRAARLMDMLESRGVVGGPKGSKPRDILVSAAEVEEMFAR